MEQNKNNTMMSYWHDYVWLANARPLKEHIKKYALQDVFTVEQIKTFIEASTIGNEYKVFPIRRFKDYCSKLNDYFHDIPGIRGYQSFEFKRELPGHIILKKLVSDTETITIDLNRHDYLNSSDSDFFQFTPSVFEAPTLTSRKKTDLIKAKRYIPGFSFRVSRISKEVY